MVKPVRLTNSRSWSTQKDALQHFKDMLGRNTHGERLADPADHDDLSALLTRYDETVAPGQATKGGGGIAVKG